MRILYSRDDGSQYLFRRPGEPICPNNGCHEAGPVSFATRQEAARLLARLDCSPARLSALRSMLPASTGIGRLAAGDSLRLLAELLWRGQILVDRRRFVYGAFTLEEVAGSGGAAMTSAAAPPPRRSAAAEEVNTFPVAHDPATQAQALKKAAESGVPFCEECLKNQ